MGRYNEGKISHFNKFNLINYFLQEGTTEDNMFKTISEYLKEITNDAIIFKEKNHVYLKINSELTLEIKDSNLWETLKWELNNYYHMEGSLVMNIILMMTILS